MSRGIRTSVSRMKKKRLKPVESYDFLETPLGILYLVFSGGLLSGISFERPRDVPLRHSESVSPVKKELTEYFEEGRRAFTCQTTFLEGTEFERGVWLCLLDVPYGETRTYKWLAEKIGRPRACRAVGNALGRNPIPVIFPCHRIIESDGSLGGYTPGSDVKRRLLDMEYYRKKAG